MKKSNDRVIDRFRVMIVRMMQGLKKKNPPKQRQRSINYKKLLTQKEQIYRINKQKLMTC